MVHEAEDISLELCSKTQLQIHPTIDRVELAAPKHGGHM